MKYLVVDSGPLIKGVRLERFGAERYVTVPEVLGELRDSQARALLESLPFELELREPERRRAIDWRTLRVELPADADSGGQQAPQTTGLNLGQESILQWCLLDLSVYLAPHSPAQSHNSPQKGAIQYLEQGIYKGSHSRRASKDGNQSDEQ